MIGIIINQEMPKKYLKFVIYIFIDAYNVENKH